MHIRELKHSTDLPFYEKWICNHPEASLWQSCKWMHYQKALGREARIFCAMNDAENEIQASAIVIIDRTKGKLSTWEIARGPIGERDATQELLMTIKNEAKKDRCMALYFSPLQSINIGTESARHVIPKTTRLIDLTQNEEKILAQMKQKGRYNIRVAEKHDVIVKESDDIGAFHTLMRKTAQRDRFTTKSKEHYQMFLEQLPNAFLLLAHSSNQLQSSNDHASIQSACHPELAEGHTRITQHDTNMEPVAGLIGIIHKNIGIYYYGASDHAYRSLMAPFALQWKAMQLCKQRGCTQYDLFGIAQPDAKNHPWKGISAFKEKFGGSILEYPAERQIIFRPFTNTLLSLKRKIFG